MIEISRSTLWWVVLVLAGALAVAFALAGLSVDTSRASFAITIFVMGGTVALARSNLHWTWSIRLGDFVETAALFSTVSLIGALASYAVATTTTGYQDDVLAAVDRALGFDWAAYYRFVAAHPAIAGLAEFCYLTIFLSPPLVIFGLTMTGQAERARTFVAAVALTLILTLIGFYFFPARSAVAYHIGMTPAYLPATGLHHIEMIEHLRDGSLTRIDPAALSGLITFPSFHMVSALLFIWAAWPLRLLRMVCTTMNVMMIVIIPVEGSHYLVDLLGGAVVVAIVMTGLYWPALGKRYGVQPIKAAMSVTT